jgi:hypothetical protein
VVGRSFDVLPGGDRFATVKAATADANMSSSLVTRIFNVFDELRRRAPSIDSVSDTDDLLLAREPLDRRLHLTPELERSDRRVESIRH